VVGPVYVADVTLFAVKVPESATPAAGVKTQVTPAPDVSRGTVAVIVDDCPALRSVRVAWRMTLS
jgi:hypothetical protein